MFLVDTNILLRSIQPHHSMYTSAVKAMTILINQGETLCITPQNIIEFWNVCTRPSSRNGLGMTLAQAEEEVKQIEGIFSLRSDLPEIYKQWRQIVVDYGVKGVNVHDAKLVAAMIVHDISSVLTFNIEDFARYSSIINVYHPDEVK